MNTKTNVEASENPQEIIITRQFELPVDLLFKAFDVPELFEQWMNTSVVFMDNRPHGSYRFQTFHNGAVVFSANGCYHHYETEKRIVRTFEMENTTFPVQLEFLNFKALNDHSSELHMQIILQSPAYRDQLLQLPFAAGLNMAHNRLIQLFN